MPPATVATVAPRRMLRLGGRAYPVVLPKLRDSRPARRRGHHQHPRPRSSLAQLPAQCAADPGVDPDLRDHRRHRGVSHQSFVRLAGQRDAHRQRVALILRVPTTPLTITGPSTSGTSTPALLRSRWPRSTSSATAARPCSTRRTSGWSSPSSRSELAGRATRLLVGAAEPLDDPRLRRHRRRRDADHRAPSPAGRRRTFWVTLSTGIGLVAASGHCMTARWAFAPVCGFDFWRAIVTSRRC